MLIIVVFYFILIRPQRKRDKTDESMRNNLEVGDVVTTRGGIVGKITNIRTTSSLFRRVPTPSRSA